MDALQPPMKIRGDPSAWRSYGIRVVDNLQNSNSLNGLWLDVEFPSREDLEERHVRSGREGEQGSELTFVQSCQTFRIKNGRFGCVA
ncbi:hypothetical protein AC579_561 [Pseudocercospora musae]|uniref:Uncharacterized protein n=1 Tax=Pseudocercospora musae TaxID=113226 RepID=A0A139IRD1_9PEZI|nr:hypothetical protein AC579_561 [Pseudocercospora musae]